MRTRNRHSCFVVGVLLGALSMTTGCSGDDRPPASTGLVVSEGASPSLPGTTTDGGVVDAGPKVESCTDVTRGEPIDSLAIAGEPPVPLGGELSPGTYDLGELDIYVAPSTDPEQNPSPLPESERAQATLIVTADTIKIARGVAGSDGAFATSKVQYGWLRTEGTNLVVDELCPTKSTTTTPYSATGPAIVLFTSKDRNEVYKLRR